MTKENRELLDKTFKTFMDVGLGGGNLDLLHDMVAKDVVGFGTTIDEKIFGVKELYALLIRQKEQSAGMEMSWKINTLDIHISNDENTAIYTNDLLFYLTVDGNTIEMYMRFSVVLEYVQPTWLVVHWHGSKPENVESEKDTWGVQTWKEKSEALEKEVAERTADLVEKNRELKIEAALEKVRARSSAMQQTHELGEVISIIFQKLDEFDISVNDGVALITFIEGSKDLNEWMANAGFGTAMHFLLPYFDHPILSNLWEAKNRGDDILIHRYSAEENRSFLHHIFEHSDFKHTPQPVKDYCLAAETYAASIAFQKHTAIFINDYSGVFLTSLEIDLLKRFSIVFEQTYTRFLDLQKAEAQTREAQIEAALERVRSRSLAMHHTSELQSVIHSVHQELLKLNLSISGGSFIAINSELDHELHCWGAGGTADTSDEVHIPRFEKPFYTHLLNGIKNGPGFFTEAYTREEKIEFFTFLFGHEPWSKLDAKQKEETLSAPGGYARSCTVSKHTSIFIINHSGEKFSDAENVILKRFGKVFEQSYTRFLDLQKAEAQAREAQIEVSLERLRSRAMAMQTSEELKALIGTVFTELTKLDLVLTRCTIMIFNGASNDSRWWMANSEDPENPMGFYVKQHDHTPMVAFFEAWHDKKLKWTYVLEGQIKKDWDDYIFSETELHHLPDFVQAGMRAPDKVNLNVSFNNFGCITLASLQPLSDEHFDIMLRFAKVFDLTYTRFNDLKYAEAQAREAKIEAALERVRSRSMAMHKSDELKETVFVMYEQLQQLNFDAHACNIIIADKISGNREFWVAGFTEKIYPQSYKVPYMKHPYVDAELDAWKRGDKYLTFEYEGKMKQDFDAIFFSQTGFKNTPEEAKSMMMNLASVKFSIAFFTYGSIQSLGKAYLSEENANVVQRFALVFEQTYTRFLDLQKAEAQAREAQIEAALERVRSRSMAMHKSEELRSVVSTLYGELQSLQVNFQVVAIQLIPDDSMDLYLWLGTADGLYDDIVHWPYIDIPVFHEVYRARTSGEILEYTISGADTRVFFDNYFELEGVPQGRKVATQNVKVIDLCGAYQQLTGILLLRYTEGAYSTYEKDIVNRFSKAFEQTYTRFLDLQKAEAQAREAQIELSLERVRAKTMAMHSSADVAETVAIMFDELIHLGVDKNARCGIGILDDDMNMEVWTAFSNTQENVGLIEGTLNMSMHPMLQGVYHAWKNGEIQSGYTLEGKDKEDYYRAINSMDYPLKFDLDNLPDIHYQNAFYFNEGIIYIFSIEILPSETGDIIKRFAKVFGQTYRRYLDLLKAEAQTREAEIQLALERVRARSLAMHHTNELQDVVHVVAQQLMQMGIDMDGGVFIAINDEVTKDLPIWAAAGAADYVQKVTCPFLDRPIFTHLQKAIGQRELFFTESYSKEQKNEFLNHLFLHHPWNINSEERKSELLARDGGFARSVSVNRYTTIGITNHHGNKFTDAENSILVRFGAVLEQSYTRFLDLQKSEAQTREAQIEAALERVRSKAMAMRSSEDIADTMAASFDELKKLGIFSFRSGVGLLTKGSNIARVFADSRSSDGQVKALTTIRNMDEHPALKQQFKAWEQQQDYEQILTGDELISYYSLPFFHSSKIEVPSVEPGKQECGYYFAFPDGLFYSWSHQPYTEGEKNILHRFRNIITLTFRRFLDLQKAEAQALEATKRASVDRVRAEIASMRTTSDLDRIQPLIWNELKTLEVPFIRCGVFIMDEEMENVQCFLSTPDGKSIAAFILPYYSTEQSKQIVSHWQQKKVFKDHMDEAAFAEYAKNLVQQGAVASDEKYVTENRPTDLYLHFLPFLQGMLYVGNDAPLSEDELQLVQNLADAFSTAYARYEDFNKLEAAKADVESTLGELKATQAQLVQQEKLASLGQLTAGIAHEIKNPLNFVNNFTEVSIELIEEALDEIQKHDGEKDSALINHNLEDIRSNLKKVHDHGTRANSIVNSMLMHSRQGSGTSDPTMLNDFIREYSNLAYHGMLAGNHPLDVQMIFDLDERVKDVPLIVEDFSRVVLNICNNAFDALRSTPKPTLIIRTQLQKGSILIQFADNGPGIPDEIKDKILQPFFTTKKGTEGTGLGLSISNDIVKAHGGELKVETMECKGSEFIIQLPV